MIPLDEALRPTWLFGQTVHEGCDRGGYYEQADFAQEYGSPLCIVKLGCWGPVVQCNVGKRGWMGGIGGCPNIGGICIGCTMPGFPDKFMPFMNQPPGSLLSSSAVQTYGKAIHALRRFTQASLNKEPSWRRRDGTFPRARNRFAQVRRRAGRLSRLRLRVDVGWPHTPKFVRQIAAQTQILADVDQASPSYAEAEAVLQELASVFFENAVADVGACTYFQRKGETGG